MKREFKFIIYVVLFSLSLAFPVITFGQKLPKFQILTEEWYPYQYEENGEVKGYAVDLLVLLLKNLGSRQGRKDIKMYPWARGYRLLQAQKNTILFSTTRTDEREKLFKWVGPIFQNSTFLIAKKNQGIKITDAKQLHSFRIGTIIDDASELFMTRLGFNLNQLERNTSSINNIKKLDNDRIDFVVSGWIAFKNDAQKIGIDPNLYTTVYKVDNSDVFYAFNNSTSDWIISKFQAELDKIKSEGKLKDIMKKYEHIMK